MEQLQGTFLAKEENKITFATADGQVKYGYASGECTLQPQGVYFFALDSKVSKAGKNYTVITGITDSTGKAVPMVKRAKKSWGGGGGGKYDSEGMARGNCRAVTTEYIVACIGKGKQPDIPAFVALLAQAEALMLKKPAPVTAPVTAPVAQVTPATVPTAQAPLI